MANWTILLGHVIDGTFALAAALISAAAAVYARRVHRAIGVPSGGTIGEKVEKTHDLAAVSVKSLHKLDGSEQEAPDG